MKTSDGIEQYVKHKRQQGYLFERNHDRLHAFCRHVRDIELSQISSLQVLRYLDGKTCSTITWRLQYQMLDRFFKFWSYRKQMPVLTLPPNRPAVKQTYVPYVFSKADIRAMLKATRPNDNSRSKINHQVVRTFIIFLYATGIGVSEALHLSCSDIDVDSNRIRIFGRGITKNRQIPIGKDICEIIRRYLVWRVRRGYKNPYLFVTKRDEPIYFRTMNKHFTRVCVIAHVRRHDNCSAPPRIMDLRYSFAVHRITSWIKNGANLNRMLPAMAAYMGQVGLGATDRYLAMTPERYRKELRILSPARGKYRWRNDQDLMKFLAEL